MILDCQFAISCLYSNSQLSSSALAFAFFGRRSLGAGGSLLDISQYVNHSEAGRLVNSRFLTADGSLDCQFSFYPQNAQIVFI
jgi:hypothetical protein